MTGRLIASTLTLLAAANVAAARIEDRGVSSGEIARLVRVESVERIGNTIRARLTNLSDDRLENVRLIVGESFRWQDERHPGPDDPSRADVVLVTEPIAPGGSVVITHTFPPRPERSDGWFKPTVEVVGLQRSAAEAAPQVTVPAYPPQ